MLREADLRQLAPGEERRHAHHSHAVPRSPRRGHGARRGLPGVVCVGRLGFPDLRVQWSSHPDPCFVVEWGERDHSRSRATALPPPWGASTATAKQP
ncbi:DUF6302 family protein [Streptomyces sp. NPDC088180]|uniref:DUF6302 family protein n=1 Tax=Streptomyces sp. NPDC088180 TaxID=3365837 RepID=UPI00380D19D9